MKAGGGGVLVRVRKWVRTECQGLVLTGLLNWLMALAARVVLWLRYNLKWRGLKKLRARKGVLFLPNHPGELDPVFLATRLWGRYRPHPVVVEDFYHMGSLHWLMKSIRAIPMPNLDAGAGSYKRLRVNQALATVLEYLRRGENVLLYPAGRQMRSGLEELRGASAVHDLLKQAPDTNIVLVRTRGFLGSSFAWATERRRPDLLRSLRRGAWWILVNFILFTPRRKLSIEFEDAPDDFPRRAGKLELNQWLDNWYNRHGPEEPALVSYCRWWRALPKVAKDDSPEQKQDIEVPAKVRRKVIAGLAKIAQIEAKTITGNKKLTAGLGFDSLNLADTVAWLEEEFFVSDVNPTDLITVYDVMTAAVGVVREDGAPAAAKAPAGWFEGRRKRPDLVLPDPEQTIPRNFLATCDRMGKAVAIADDSMVLTYKRLKLSVLVLAGVFRKWPDERLGIMLPATAGVNVIIMAVLLTGKIPVMINWTLGDASLRHVLEIAGIKRIITSGRFLDRLEQLNLELLQDYLLTLEDIRASEITRGLKLKALLRRGKSPKALCRLYGSGRLQPDDRAVILFTSGSESLPKGVPLSHRNILADIRGAAKLGGIITSDVLYGFLPPFHSFGFTVTCIFPLVTGFKTAYYPNPTESRKLVRGIEAWKPTVFGGTPTFISGVFKAARPGQLDSVRLILSGAEKTPAELFEQARKLNITILEGYGITETAPVLTLTPAGQKRVGVGRPVGDVKIRIVDLETREALPVGERGLILARGSNVFSGYLARDSSDAFCELEGHTWYVTGDLGFLDKQGNLTISGRLKRFVKVGGEMLSLPAMEEAITRNWPNEEGLIRTAIGAVDREGDQPLLCLFSVLPLTLEEANSVLKSAGFPNLARLSKVIRLEEIPLLGTGKTDYRELTRRLKTELKQSE